jgi:antibiotic biosynthesis monooxygenase (ABM) superfamily enzyme
MIARIWHGYTSLQNADAYESLLKEEIFVAIENKNIKGYKGIQLLRRNSGEEVEFTTIMWFDDIESVKQFAGENYEKAYIPASAGKILLRFDATSAHSEVRRDLRYNV